MGLFPTRTTSASAALGSRAYAGASAPVCWGPQTRTDTETVRVPERAGFGPRKALLYCVGGLVAAAFWGSHNHRSWWWIAALLLAIAVRVGLGRLDRAVERRYAGAVGLAACCWLAVAWQIGPYRPLTALSLLVLSPIAVLPWVWHRRVRGMATVDWPRVPAHVRAAPRFLLELGSAVGRQWGAGRELRRMQAAWPWLAATKSINLPGSSLVGGHWSADGTKALTLQLEDGRKYADVVDVRERIEAAWKCGVGCLSVEVGERADRAVLRATPNVPAPVLPLSVERPWPGASLTSATQPIPLGEWEDGSEILLHLTTADGMVAGHWLVAGQTRWGKSGVLNVILATLAGCTDVVFWGLDPKGGLELGPWHPLLAKLATSARDAVPFLQAANAERERRERVLRERGLRKWVPSPEDPLMLLIVDEASRLGEDAMALLDDLCAMGAALGILVIVCTQRPSAKKLGQSGDLRSQLGSQIALHMRDATDAGLVFGESGWPAHELRDRGALYIYHELGGYEDPRPGRAYLVSDEAVARTVARHASVRSQPDSTSEIQERPVSSDGERSSRIVPLLPAMPVAAAELVALHVATDPDGDDPLYRLRSALRVAPPEGFHVAELERRTGMSESWLRVELRAMSASGEAVKVRRAYWRAGADSPVRALVQEGQQ